MTRRRIRWAVLLLLLIFFGRLLHTASIKSVTYDEVIHIFAAAHYWEGERMAGITQNPPLVNAVIGVPLSLAFDPAFPGPIEPVSDWLGLSKQFMWEVNDNGLQMIWVSRVAIMGLATLLAALVYRWGRRLFRHERAGLLALLLFTFDPNVLAHSFLATTDLGTAFFVFLAAYLVWNYWRAPGRAAGIRYAAAGIAIGLAFSAKFSGLVLVPALLLMAAFRWLTLGDERPSPGRVLGEIAGWLVIGALVFFAVYRFDWQTLQLDFAWQRQHQLSGRRSFLLGTFTRGTWRYFPIVFAVKTPLPTLALLALGVATFVARRRFDWQRTWVLLLPAGVGAAALVSRVNIGYRYLLPALPFLFLFLGQLAQPGFLQRRAARWGAALAMGLTVVISLWFHPDYLAYFNRLAGGPDEGWRMVVDSNIDWGQDLQALGRTMDAHDIDFVNANYLGTAPLDAYNIPGRVVPGWPLAKVNPLYDWFYPQRPAPGFYAFSVTQLQGLYLKEDRSRFWWFRGRPPLAKAGYSIFLYDVPADGPPVGLALSGIGLGDVALDDFNAAFASNDVRPRWFDARTSFLWPGGREGETAWLAVGDGHLPSQPALQALYPAGGPTLRGTDETGRLHYNLFRLPQLTAPGRDLVAHDAVFGAAIRFLGYEQVPAADGLGLLSYWRVLDPPAGEIKLFVHVLDGSGQVVAQHDGLDVLAQGLHAGDVFVQLHPIPLPPELPPGRYTVQIGVYDATTLERLPLPDGSDHLPLPALSFTHPAPD